MILADKGQVFKMFGSLLGFGDFSLVWRYEVGYGWVIWVFFLSSPTKIDNDMIKTTHLIVQDGFLTWEDFPVGRYATTITFRKDAPCICITHFMIY